MTGRHRVAGIPVHETADSRGSGGHRARIRPADQPARPRRYVILAAIVGVALLVGGAVVQLRPHAQDAAAHSGCTGSLPVPVIAAPGIAHAVSTVVAQWRKSAPDAGGACIHPTVTSQDSYHAEQALVQSSRATIWIPESTVWRARLIQDVPSLAPLVTAGQPVATSPLVIAATPGHASAVAATAKQGWAAQFAGTTPIAIPDPTRNADGALALVGLATQLGSSPEASGALAGAAVRLAGNVMPSAATGFKDLQSFPGSAPPFITSEQAVIRANRATPTPIATAVYPSGYPLALDFPLIAVTPATSPAFVDAARALTDQLRGAGGRQALAAAGLRDATGAPLDDQAESPGGYRPVTPTPLPSAAPLAEVMRVWVAARRPDALLAVIDVSGSMKDDSGNGRSKIEVASQAAAAAITLVPDAWSVGLWSFSSKPSPAQDWTQLVPLGSVKAQRAALVAAANGLGGGVGGDTALYATALAAFTYVNTHYAPDKVDSVVLMTDGGNVDPGGIHLPTLLAALKHGYNHDKPVSITTIALGKDADVAALRQISAATGGTTYVVRNPQDIRSVLVQSVLRRS